MIPDRIKTRADFLKVQNAGNKSVSPAFILHGLVKDSADPQLRVGFTVTKKVGKAVTRNKARRRLKAMVHEVFVQQSTGKLDLSKDINALDLAIIARGYATNRDFDRMCKEFYQTLLKTKWFTS